METSESNSEFFKGLHPLSRCPTPRRPQRGHAVPESQSRSLGSCWTAARPLMWLRWVHRTVAPHRCSCWPKKAPEGQPFSFSQPFGGSSPAKPFIWGSLHPQHKKYHTLTQRLANSVKCWTVNILDFADHLASKTETQLPCNEKTAIENMQTNEYVCDPMNRHTEIWIYIIFMCCEIILLIFFFFHLRSFLVHEPHKNGYRPDLASKVDFALNKPQSRRLGLLKYKLRIDWFDLQKNLPWWCK